MVTDALLALKDAGISEKIILAVLIASQGSRETLAAAGEAALCLERLVTDTEIEIAGGDS